MRTSLTARRARDTVAGMARGDSRVPYPEAARSLLRSSVLDAMRDLLTERDWSKITISDVARAAGVSRQTLYNEFGSRTGLAQAYAMQLADVFVDHVDRALWEHVGDVRQALRSGLTTFFVDISTDPLIHSLVTGEVKPDLLRLITIDALPLLDRATERLATAFQRSWVSASAAESEVLARMLVRVAMSYIGIPPKTVDGVPEDLAAVIGPYVDTILARQELEAAAGRTGE